MGNMKFLRKQKIILVPYPAQGHVTPMVKLGLALANHGFEPILVVPEFIHHQIVASIDQDSKIECISIPDGLNKNEPLDFFSIEKAMEHTMPIHLDQILSQLDKEVVCLVADLLASWAIEVARLRDVPVAGFWSAMLATYRVVCAIPEMVRQGIISDSGIPTTDALLQNHPTLTTNDLPWLIGTTAAKKSRFKFWRKTLERSKSLKWLLVNSFPEEETIENEHNHKMINCSMENHSMVLPIGPLNNHGITKNPSFWEEDTTCLDWLDKQKPNSVIYVSFGSWVSPIGDSKVRTLALALESLDRPFLWVLRSSWRENLPFGYLEGISKRGKIVSWAPQMKVLQHKAIGCFLTHCGWNSTMEAIQCRKPLLCYPIAGDQSINCSYIVELWKIGVKINGLGCKEAEEGIRRLMEDNEIDSRLEKVYQMTLGKGCNLKVMVNLSTFCDDIKIQGHW
ncbi:hypothetical protein ACFE04_031257 [Oxalis oulophora]